MTPPSLHNILLQRLSPHEHDFRVPKVDIQGHSYLVPAYLSSIISCHSSLELDPITELFFFLCLSAPIHITPLFAKLLPSPSFSTPINNKNNNSLYLYHTYYTPATVLITSFNPQSTLTGMDYCISF